jgi:hypothetical protein
MPRTGADAFLPPETSTATGPLFGKRAEATDASAAPSDPAAGQRTASERAEKVARVVPITALASRQRAQAEQEARGAETAPAPVEEPAAEQTAPVEHPAAEQPVEQPARAHDPLSDPLSDPLPADAFDEPVAVEAPVAEPEPELEPEPVAEEPVVEAPVAEEPVVEEPVADEPAAQADHHVEDVEVDADDPLGLGAPVRQPASDPEPEPVEEPVARHEPAPVPSYDPAAVLTVDHGTNGLPHPAEPARAGGESPIFKSMRSGWLAGEGKGEWHETEVDRGWEIAETVTEPAPVVESTPVGLPRRAPGERLVPGSVTPPTAAKTRDPEAIRRRLQAHKAGVSRGRAAAQSSTQHTEAGPA